MHPLIIQAAKKSLSFLGVTSISRWDSDQRTAAVSPVANRPPPRHAIDAVGRQSLPWRHQPRFHFTGDDVTPTTVAPAFASQRTAQCYRGFYLSDPVSSFSHRLGSRRSARRHSQNSAGRIQPARSRAIRRTAGPVNLQLAGFASANPARLPNVALKHIDNNWMAAEAFWYSKCRRLPVPGLAVAHNNLSAFC